MNYLYERIYKDEIDFETKLNIQIDKIQNIKSEEKAYITNYLYKILIIILIYMILIEFNKDLNVSPIKVAYFYNSIRYGGIERVLALLLSLLSEKKMFIFYLTLRPLQLRGLYILSIYISLRGPLHNASSKG